MARQWTGKRVRVIAATAPRGGDGRDDVLDVESRGRRSRPDPGRPELGA
jgi:hypothetical protein